MQYGHSKTIEVCEIIHFRQAFVGGTGVTPKMVILLKLN